MRRVINGADECYVCGKVLNWESEVNPPRGGIVAYRVPDITAEVIACGKNEDGTVKFEILCKCPNCRTKNKYYRNE